MKYDCSKEFDLDLIFSKLTAPVAPSVVRACDFFDKPRICTLKQAQEKMERLDKMRIKVK